MPGQRTQAARHPAAEEHRQTPDRLDQRTPCRAGWTAVPDQHRRSADQSGGRKLVARHTATAAELCPSLAGKNITPHTLRHTCAMSLLHAGIDTASIALWLGHATIQTTQVYLHADLELKRRTLERVPSLDERPPARYQASDALIAFLKNR